MVVMAVCKLCGVYSYKSVYCVCKRDGQGRSLKHSSKSSPQSQGRAWWVDMETDGLAQGPTGCMCTQKQAA